jgi:hypothetical protein
MVPLAPCLVLGAVLESIGPPAGVVTELGSPDLEALRAAGILEPDEVLVAACFDSLGDVSDSGSLITDRRVVSYWLEGDVRWIDARPRDRVIGVETRPGALGFGLDVTVSVNDDVPLELAFGLEDDGRQFVAHLSGPVPTGAP